MHLPAKPALYFPPPFFLQTRIHLFVVGTIDERGRGASEIEHHLTFAGVVLLHASTREESTRESRLRSSKIRLWSVYVCVYFEKETYISGSPSNQAINQIIPMKISS